MNYNLLGLFLTASFNFWQQPLAHGGLLDPRYPDYIVDPLVKCPDYGFFVHPRNCSWFYRCHGSENLKGFYRRDYFECAPGTAFSSALKICDFDTYKTCNNSQDTDCSTCNLVNVDHCEYYDVCPDAGDKENPVSLGLCENPTFACERCSNLSPCKKGEWLFSEIATSGKQQLKQLPTKLHTCYPSPNSMDMICTSPTTTPSPTPEPCNDCSTTVSRCRVYEICPNAGDAAVNRTLCSVATNDCLPCNSSENVCNDGSFYEMEDQKCYPSPDTMQCPCNICSIVTSNCSNYNVCPSGNNPGVELTLCSNAGNYCDPCGSTTDLCPEGQFFSTGDQKCYPSPDTLQCPCNICSIVTSNCRTYNVCSSGNNPGVELNLCSHAGNYCDPCGNITDLCPEGQFFSTGDQKCYPSPDTLQCPCNICSIVTSNCRTYNVCPRGNNPGVELNLCSNAGNYCDPCGNTTDLCPEGQFFSTGDQKCYPSPDTLQCPCNICSIVTSNCSNYNVCPSGNNPGVELNLCSNAGNYCDPCGNTTDLCPQGQFFSTGDQKCYPSPDTLQCPCNICSIVTSNCSNYNVCPSGNNPGVELNLCSNAGNYCDPCGNTTDLCPQGQFFSTGDQKCYPSPDTLQCPCNICSTVTNNCSNYNVCPSGNNPGVELNLCSNAGNYCDPCGNTTDLCPEGQFFSTGDQKCYPSPDTLQCPCNICSTVTSNCSNYNVCPSGNNPGVELNLCSNAVNYCDPCGNTTDLCLKGQFYSTGDHECYPSPDSMTCPCNICSIVTQNCSLHTNVCPTGKNPGIDMTLCSSAGNFCKPCGKTTAVCEGQLYSAEDQKCYPNNMTCPCDDCYISASRCQAHVVCPNGGPPRNLTLCPTSKTLCDPCGSERDVCPRGQHYAMETGICYPPYIDPSMVCNPKSQVIRDSPPLSSQDLVSKAVPALQCSGINFLPQSQWIKEKFCKNYQPCSRSDGQPSGVLELCRSYYECVYRVSDQSWTSVKKHCTGNRLFSYEAEKCVSEPENICRVF